MKQNAPELLDKALKSKRKKCMIGTGYISDPYLHCEEEIKLTRRCLEVILKNEFGLAIQTKSDRILRDIDLLEKINKTAKCVVQMTLTTYDDELCKIIEPNVCNTKRRIEVLEQMRERGIPTIVWLSPILPFINRQYSTALPMWEKILVVGSGPIRIGQGIEFDYCCVQLDKHFPGMKERYIKTYGNAYELLSPNTEELEALLHQTCKENGILSNPDDCFKYMNDLPEKYKQLSLFD